ncbi:MAG: type II secretion system F family protein [Thaumarchaeota archaeon]|nr:type II secretion system F family protein [Nitrososphaerota archaeon]
MFDRFSLVSYRIFKAPAERISKRIPLLREDLLRSNLRVTPVGLIAVALFSTVVSGVVALGIIAWAATTPYFYLYFVAVAPLVAFLVVINGPKFSHSSRGAALENELPFVVGYMSVLAGGGITLIDTLRQISEIDLFTAASKEAKRILIDIDVFGRDPISALERAAKYSPNRNWEELLTGYTTVLRTGGDHVNFLSLRLKETFEIMAAKLKRTVEMVGLISESFLIVTVVLGMVLFTLYLTETLVNGNAGGLSSVYLFSYLVVPILSAAFIWLIDAYSQKWPSTDMRAYKIFLAFIPLGLIIFLIPLPLRFYQHMAISLLAISAVPALYATKYSRERRTVERMIPEFIEDVAEQRKIGLSPEDSIERLEGSTRYGSFSKHVNKMAGQLSWGVPLRKVVASFSNEVHSWVGRVVGTLMLEVVEIGGGTLKGFEDMAAFTKRVSVTESDTRSSLRPYVMIIYIGGLMLTLTTFMMVNMLSQQSILAPKGIHTSLGFASPATIDGLVGASVFQTWVLGLVAGKMGEGSLAEGFKHSVILVLLTLLAVVVVGRFIPLNI